MPHKDGQYVSDNDYLGRLRKTFAGFFKPKTKPVPKESLMGKVQERNKVIRDLTEGKY